MARHCEAIVELQKRGAVAFDYGNNLRGEAKQGGFAEAFAYSASAASPARRRYSTFFGSLPLSQKWWASRSRCGSSGRSAQPTTTS